MSSPLGISRLRQFRFGHPQQRVTWRHSVRRANRIARWAAPAEGTLGIGVRRGEYFVSSDASPLVGRTDQIVDWADHQIAVLTPEEFSVLHRDQGKIRVDIQQLEVAQSSQLRTLMTHKWTMLLLK
jgi:glucosamine 6-phosphate synthetase-like amidotransferase/phosphosugar isomerase protein